ncbi:MAG: NADP-dependent oxidoreductase [Rhodospirillales bacterium]|nr:NADP-dependent oxidoreductase [Rhodospirillales bacterium]
MKNLENRRVLLNARPVGVPGADYFSIDEQPVNPLKDGEFLIHNSFLSVDPAMRGWVNDAPNYSPPVPVGSVMRAFAVGEIIASNHPGYAVGETVSGLFGWQRFAISNGDDVMRRVDDADLSPTLALGVLGLNGITAYFGLLDLCDPQPGETVVVSTAAGAVGSCVGQIAKIRGCKTVGIAGGADKVHSCLNAFGYDAAIDYKNSNDLEADIGQACADGVDGYFDNTCGPISDAVFANLALGARITVCGTAAIQEWQPLPVGPRVHRQLMVNRARMSGFLVLDYKARYAEAVAALANWVRSGEITYREHILDGFEQAPQALQMLYRGENNGKLLIRVD